MEELPPAELKPRISNSVWPGPAERMAMPGTEVARELKSTMPRSAISCADTAVMLAAVSCTVLVRFSAVTTTSWSWSAETPLAAWTCWANALGASASPSAMATAEATALLAVLEVMMLLPFTGNCRLNVCGSRDADIIALLYVQMQREERTSRPLYIRDTLPTSAVGATMNLKSRLSALVIGLCVLTLSSGASAAAPAPASGTAMDRDLMEVTIPQLHRYYEQRKYTVTQVVDWYLARIARYNGVY